MPTNSTLTEFLLEHSQTKERSMFLRNNILASFGTFKVYRGGADVLMTQFKYFFTVVKEKSTREITSNKTSS